jgi:hypothetical protein
MKISYNKKNFELKFGFGVFFILGKMWNLEGIQSIFKKVLSSMQWAAVIDFDNPENTNFEEIDIPLETFEVLADIIRASIVADKSNGITLDELDPMDICTWIFENQQHIGPIMNAFISSMPKAKPEETGKSKAVKPTAK